MGMMNDYGDNGNTIQALREQRKRGVQEQGKALNTRLNQARQIKAWQSWCADIGVQDFPASPADIVEYLYDQAEQGYKLGTLRVRLWGISVLHGGNGDDPTKNDTVTSALRGIGQIIGKPQEQASPLDSDALEAIERTACNRRSRRDGKGESSWVAERRGIKDIAIAYVLSDCGLRRSEAAALIWEDVQEQEGIGIVHIRKSKTDQSGEGQAVALTPKGYAALLRYRAYLQKDATVADSDRVFSLSDKGISNRVKSMAKAAALEGNYSGHSGRVGLAVRAARSGFSAGETMVQGRWKRADTVARYQRGIESTELVTRLK